VKIRQVAQVCTLTNAHTNPPPNASRVLALTNAGCLIQLVWSKTSIEWCSAWCPFPAVPDDVKKLLGDKYLVKGEAS